MSMNLLPWRIEAHQKRLRYLAFYTTLFALVAINLMLVLNNQLTRQQQDLQTQQKNVEQFNQQLRTITQNIVQLRSLAQNVESVQPIDSSQIQANLQWLSNLPFQQGALTQFQQDAQSFSLEGTAQDQREFEALHQFLKTHFPQVKLSHFQPEQHALYFRFEWSQGETQ